MDMHVTLLGWHIPGVAEVEPLHLGTPILQANRMQSLRELSEGHLYQEYNSEVCSGRRMFPIPQASH